MRGNGASAGQDRRKRSNLLPWEQNQIGMTLP